MRTRIWSASSIEPGADCMDVQTGLALYWWQRLLVITGFSSRIRVKLEVYIFYYHSDNVLLISEIIMGGKTGICILKLSWLLNFVIFTYVFIAISLKWCKNWYILLSLHLFSISVTLCSMLWYNSSLRDLYFFEFRIYYVKNLL